MPTITKIKKATFRKSPGAAEELKKCVIQVDVKWLINRVDELEKKLSINTNNMKQLQKQNVRYKQALEEISNADWNSEGLDAERELDRITDIAFKALEGTE